MKLVSVVVLLLAPLLASCYEFGQPVDCSDIYKHDKNQPSGVYTIYPAGDRSAVQVYCDMDSLGGRWTVFQRRMDGSVNFYRPWDHYKVGFGSAAGEHWLGLDNIHYLTNHQRYELLVDMEDFAGANVFARYSSFSVGPECGGYILHVSGFINGGAGDSLRHHNGHKFTTLDKDQDSDSSNCARKYLGAFWYNKCHNTNPNGVYRWGADKALFAVGVEWYSWKGFNYSLKTISMKIRPSIRQIYISRSLTIKLVSVVVLLLAPLLASCSELGQPVDCSDIYKHDKNQPSGVYTIYPAGDRSAVQVYCDMDSLGGRWTVFQRRMDGSVNFYRPWDHYKVGFGSAAGEHWLGLDNIHYLTNHQRYELLVDMEDFKGANVFARYSSFSVGPECGGYVLHVSGFINGGAGDSLRHHNGHKFTTLDKDQDSSNYNCARRVLGAFWYNQCHATNPNGVYRWGADKALSAVGVEWYSWKGYNYSLKTISMKIRPVQ